MRPVSAIILAGGQGQRMGGLDKGLQSFRGKPLIAYALKNMQQQSQPVAEILISANRNLQIYQSYGFSVASDDLPGFQGPLAGVLTGLLRCRSPLLLTAPCDVPFFPADLLQRLLQALQSQGADVATVVTTRMEPAFSLMSRHLHDDLHAFMHSGGRKFHSWLARHQSVAVEFDAVRYPLPFFANINTPEQLQEDGRQT